MKMQLTAVLLAAATPFAACAGAPDALRRDLAAAIAGSGLGGAKVSVSVRDMRTGQVLAEVDGSRPMVPASNMKVLTTGAALHVLGPDFVFRTRLVRQGDRLTVVGDGDPSLGDPALVGLLTHTDAQGNRRPLASPEELIDIWANAARRAGIATVSEVVADDRVFDRQFTHPLWPADQLDDSYCARVSGIAFHENLVGAVLRAAGGRASVAQWQPEAPWLQADPGKSSANPKGKQTIGILRTQDPNRFVLSGNLQAAGTDPVPICVQDVPAFVAQYVGSRLARAGITVGACRVASAADPVPGTEQVGPALTMPLAQVVKRCNEESQNMYAEALLKRIGAARTRQPGSWANGIAALRASIDERLGTGASAAYAGSDGSGLSRENRVSANLLTAWIQSIAADPKLGEVFLTSLAEGGREGTVKKRFKGLDPAKARVQCKTGYINGVSCLSGCVGPASGAPRYAFSVLCNDLAGVKDGVGKAKALQDRVALILAAQP